MKSVKILAFGNYYFHVKIYIGKWAEIVYLHGLIFIFFAKENIVYIPFSLPNVKQESQELEQILNAMSHSQRGRMEEQRCTLSPVKTRQVKNTGLYSRQKDAISMYVSICRLIVDCVTPTPSRFTLWRVFQYLEQQTGTTPWYHAAVIAWV